VADLIAAIQRFITAWNERCRPFTWTKDPDTVMVKSTHPRNRKTNRHGQIHPSAESQDEQTSDTNH